VYVQCFEFVRKGIGPTIEHQLLEFALAHLLEVQKIARASFKTNSQNDEVGKERMPEGRDD
jgi:hypothetical protein